MPTVRRRRPASPARSSAWTRSGRCWRLSRPCTGGGLTREARVRHVRVPKEGPHAQASVSRPAGRPSRVAVAMTPEADTSSRDRAVRTADRAGGAGAAPPARSEDVVSGETLDRSKIRPEHLERAAFVYVRQSSPQQVGMVEGGGGARLALEAFEGVGLGGELFRQELEGHGAPEPRVLGLVDDAHAPAAQLLDDAVVGEQRLADHSSASGACDSRLVRGSIFRPWAQMTSPARAGQRCQRTRANPDSLRATRTRRRGPGAAESGGGFGWPRSANPRARWRRSGRPRSRSDGPPPRDRPGGRQP